MKFTTNMKISLGAMACACLVLTSVHATPIDLTVDPTFPPGTTAYVLGAVDPAVPASDAAAANYINAILGLSLGGSGQVSGSGGHVDYIYRSENVFGSLPTATTAGDVLSSGSPSTSISLTTGYTYLVAKYAGGNGGGGGMEVWDIASIAAGSTIDVPLDAFGAGNNQYGLSGWVLFNSTGSQNVPDGDWTALLLGFALFGIAAARWYQSIQGRQNLAGKN